MLVQTTSISVYCFEFPPTLIPSPLLADSLYLTEFLNYLKTWIDMTYLMRSLPLVTMNITVFIISCSFNKFLFSTVTSWNDHFYFSWSKNWGPCHHNPNSTRFFWICRVKIRWNIISIFDIHNFSNDQNSILYPYFPHFVNFSFQSPAFNTCVQGLGIPGCPNRFP